MSDVIKGTRVGHTRFKLTTPEKIQEVVGECCKHSTVKKSTHVIKRCAPQCLGNGMGTSFLEYLFNVPNTMLGALFHKRIVEPGGYDDLAVPAENIGQSESWSPDLHLGLVGLGTHSSFHRRYGKTKDMDSPLWKHHKGDVLWQWDFKPNTWSCL